MGAMASGDGGGAAGAQRGPMAPLPALGGAGRLRTAAGRRRPSVSGSGGGGAALRALSVARRDGGDRGEAEGTGGERAEPGWDPRVGPGGCSPPAARSMMARRGPEASL